MKKNKISIRIFAIIATLILTFALAIPCFADEEQNEVYDSFISQIPAEMNTPALEGLMYMVGDDLMAFDTVCSGYVTAEQDLTGFAGHDSDFQAVVQGDFVIDNAGEIYFCQNYYLVVSSSADFLTIVILEDLDLDTSIVAFFTYGISIDDMGLHYAYLGDLNVGGMSIPVEDASSVSIAYGLYNNTTGLHNNVPSVLFGSFDVLHPATYSTAYEQGTLGGGDNGDTVCSGMFGQLYNILKDAIFGSDVTLDNNQDFVLTQISTWLTYIVLLLPILVIGIILWKVFIR